MVTKLNWDEIEQEAASNKKFLDYAPNGEHRAKVKSVEKKDNGNGWFEIQFEDGEYKFPKLSFAFFSDEKIKYRAHYYKEVMKQLGAEEDQARKAVEICESKSSRADVHKAYAEAFNKLAKKHLTMPIEVRDQYDRDGNPVRSANGTIYSESVFHKATGLQFPSNGAKKSAPKSDDILEQGEEIDLGEDSLPF